MPVRVDGDGPGGDTFDPIIMFNNNIVIAVYLIFIPVSKLLLKNKHT